MVAATSDSNVRIYHRPGVWLPLKGQLNSSCCSGKCLKKVGIYSLNIAGGARGRHSLAFAKWLCIFTGKAQTLSLISNATEGGNTLDYGFVRGSIPGF